MTRTVSLLAVMTWAAGAWADDAAPRPVTFEGDVRPILRKHCVACHNEERPRGDLDLTSYAGVLAGGVSGKAVVAGKPEASLLFTLTAHLEDPKMPPNQPKIPQREIDTLARWIEGGLIEKAGAAATRSPVAAPVAAGLVAAVPLARRTPVTALAVSPTAPLLAAPGVKQVLVFDLATGKLAGAVPFPEGEVHVLRFSRDGRVLLAAGGVGGQSGAVVGFEVGSWKRLFAVTDETDAVLAADLAPDRSQVAFGGPARVVKVASVPDGKVLHTHRKNTDWVTAVAYSPEGLLLAAGDRFGGLYVWDTKDGKEFATLRGHTKAVTGLAWHADSERLASASEDGTVRLWDLHTGQERHKWTAHEPGVADVAFISAECLVTGGRDQRLRTWDLTGRRRGEFGPTPDIVTRVAASPDGRSLIAGDWSGQVLVWPTEGGEAVSLPLPLAPARTVATAVPVPTPDYPTAPTAARPAEEPARPAAPVLPADLERKRLALKAVEEAVERLKEEAARDPKNPALAKAYLQLCEAALTMKAEVLAAEAALKPAP